MGTFVLNYRIIIEPELDKKTGKKVFVALCPKLGVADWGKTREDALAHIHEGIESYLESLIKHQKPIPDEDTSEFTVATTTVSFPKNLRPTFC